MLSSYFTTVWLFTYSDMKTIIFPQSIFGVIAAYTACLMEQPPSFTHGMPYFFLTRFPLSLLWTWSNVLPFNIFNQLGSQAIEEDRVNKPWRPLASGRVNERTARYMMYSHYVMAIVISSYIGGLRQSLSLLILGTWYNAFGGADKSFLVRNIINAFGYISFMSGAMEVAMGARLMATRSLVQWFGILGLVIFLTVQIQDISDTEGDRLRGRVTMPLVFGHVFTRWWTAALIWTFSSLCPAYWSLTWHSFVALVGLGSLVAIRMLIYRSVEADKRTFQIWNAWLVSIYMLPLIRFMAHGC
ncbi:UbiA prenyltransferase family-domain-containing protein [Xylaria flabelliformis]|nr:UbiA prenyltransferase family-domain-containing protein [Xylaria flabelliformis]